VSIGQRVKALRNGLGMQRRRLLAAQVGCEDAYLAGVETGRIVPSTFWLCRIARALGVTVSELTEEEA
jgi:transcriptional regulator with XRE-family HTH domain